MYMYQAGWSTLPLQPTHPALCAFHLLGQDYQHLNTRLPVEESLLHVNACAIYGNTGAGLSLHGYHDWD